MNSTPMVNSEIRPSVFLVKVSDLIVFSIGMMFIADASNAILQFYQSPFSRVSLIVRLLLEAFFGVLLLIRFHENAQFFTRVVILVACFAISAVAGSLVSPNYAWGENLISFNKLLWLFLCWYTFKTYIKSPQMQNVLFRLYEWILFIQNASILLGFLLKIPAFASYTSYRIGYKGLIPAQNEASIFYLIAFFYCAIQVSRYNRCKLLLLMTTVAAVITGTKVGLGIPVLLVFFAVFYWGFRSPKIALGILSGVLLIALLVFINWQTVYERILPTIIFFSSKARQEGIVYLITSGREDLFLYALQYIREHPYLVLIGGYDTASRFIEMDPVDIFLSLGLLGTIVYYYWLTTLLIVKPIRLNIQLIFFVVLIIVSTLAGHFIYSAINGAYVTILIMTFRYKEEIR